MAVKVLMSEFIADKSQRKQLEHELRVGQDLDHPHLIRIHRLEVHQRMPCLVMDLFPHPNLRRGITSATERERTMPKAVKILVGIAEGLGFIHGKGWVHRDVKPANVLVAPDGDVRVLDYAIAGQPPGAGPAPVDEEAGPGNAQLHGPRADPGAAVRFPFRCLFARLSGLRDARRHAAVHRSRPERSPRQAHLCRRTLIEATNRNVTAAASKLIRQMMAKKPADRPASMEEIVRQLKQVRFFERDPGAA